MPARRGARKGLGFSLPFILLCILLAFLWLAGGASRADALGQVVVRGASWALLIVLIVFGTRPSLAEGRPVVVLLAAAAALAALQLVPLPPSIWQALPGRAMLAEAAAAAGQPQPWRPWSIVPSATANALSSLIVPATALVLLAGVGPQERDRLPGLLLILIAASAIMGLVQLSGAGPNNPLINDTVGEVGGTFANRNHFALLLAIGCCVAPVWAIKDGRLVGWRSALAVGLILLFVLLILGTGSRAGLILALVALVFGLVFAWQPLKRRLSNMPRWVVPAVAAAVVAMVGIFVVISISADRAVSVTRVLDFETQSDTRSKAISTVVAMVWTYFPAGSGIGGFDPVFRIHEPFELLKYAYFNHAHNDYLEIVLDAGVLGLLLLVAGIAWWAVASVRAWRPAGRGAPREARLGSAILLLVLIASVLDYPARTPLIMAVMVWAAWWLSARTERASHRPLPRTGQHL